MKISKRKLKKLLPFFKKLPRILAKNAFLTFLTLLFFSLIFGVFIFYQYSISTRVVVQISEEEKPLKFKENIYQEILKIWQEKDKRYEATYSKEYSDPFRGIKKELPGSISTTTLEEIEEGEEEQEQESEQEMIPGLSSEEIKNLLAADNLTKFYGIKGEKLPSQSERAKIWEEKGLGNALEYYGSKYQNEILLEALKKELTE